MGRDLIDHVRSRLESWCARGIGPSVVVAVSGGSDSVALLRLMSTVATRLGLRLTVAHLDHGVRGAIAEADARFVAALAESLGLPCDLGSWRPIRPGHFEADARQARYQWLAEIARGRGANAVALGHTRDDQAETILHRIVRGTGPRGLAGMPARRRLDADIELIRPLLEVRREALRAYLEGVGQDWREDATNVDLGRTRARIRHDLIPKLEHDYNPRVVAALARLGALAGAQDRRLRRRLERVWPDVVIAVDPSEVILRRVALRALSAGLRAELFREVWRRAGWPERGMTAARWQRLGSLDLERLDRASIGGGIDVEVAPEFVRLAPARRVDAIPNAPVLLEIPGVVELADGRLLASFHDEIAGGETMDADRIACWIGADGRPCLRVDFPRAGDRFKPLGMGGRSTPLNDFFRGRGVAKADRARVPLVRDRAGIIWVVGHRIADHVQITKATTRRLRLKWHPTRSGPGPESP